MPWVWRRGEGGGGGGEGGGRGGGEGGGGGGEGGGGPPGRGKAGAGRENPACPPPENRLVQAAPLPPGTSPGHAASRLTRGGETELDGPAGRSTAASRAVPRRSDNAPPPHMRIKQHQPLHFKLGAIQHD